MAIMATGCGTPGCGCVPCFSADIDEVLSEVSSLASRVQDADSAGQFEWVDSVLVTALKYGHWLCITNANFCRSGHTSPGLP